MPLVSQNGPCLLVRDVKHDSYGERQTANCSDDPEQRSNAAAM